MKSQQRMTVQCLLTIGALLGATMSAHGTPVTDFFSLKATPATTLSGTGNTDDPVLGTAAATADGARLMGYFAPQSLTNIGDSITLSYSLAFTVGTIVNSSDNFRYALYDRNGETPIATDTNLAVAGNDNTDQFRGYWYGVDTNTGATGAQGTIRERAGTDLAQDDPFANASATQIGSPGGTEVTLASGATYTGTMTLTLTGANEITLTGSFSGTNTAGVNTFSLVDTTPTTKTFSVVGFLNGGGINADQVSFQNVDVNFLPIPEASSVALIGLVAGVSGLGAWLRRRASS
jgi:hypothetical protein